MLPTPDFVPVISCQQMYGTVGRNGSKLQDLPKFENKTYVIMLTPKPKDFIGQS
jgi:hypothetical protein